MTNSASQPTFILNNTTTDHGNAIKIRLRGTERFICMVAFAKASGFSIFEAQLGECIRNGMRAIFVVGIDFYQTDPTVLEKLLKLKARGKVEVYMGTFERKWTFHPKLYLFEGARGASVIVGSANMTSGGLEDNHELSVAFDNSASAMGQEIENWIDSLCAEGEIVEATNELVKEYARQHAIYSPQVTIALRVAERSAVSLDGGVETLTRILQEMKADASDEGFDSSVEERKTDRKAGLKILTDIASDRRMTTQEFLDDYERLIATMHSSGLHRGKTTVARSQEKFRDGIRSLLKLKDRDPAALFDHLRTSFEEVDRAGTNIITEILHLLDNKRFAVMNRNSVSGMGIANIRVFPERPTKQNVDGNSYALFCAEAGKLCKDLGLDNFSELDAVFNYAYWRDLGD